MIFFGDRELDYTPHATTLTPYKTIMTFELKNICLQLRFLHRRSLRSSCPPCNLEERERHPVHTLNFTQRFFFKLSELRTQFECFSLSRKKTEKQKSDKNLLINTRYASIILQYFNFMSPFFPTISLFCVCRMIVKYIYQSS